MAQAPAAVELQVQDWDETAALAALNGQRNHLIALRELFLAELRCARRGRAVDQHDERQLRSQLHRLQASRGFVGAARLGRAVRCITHRLRAGPGGVPRRGSCPAALRVFRPRPAPAEASNQRQKQQQSKSWHSVGWRGGVGGRGRREPIHGLAAASMRLTPRPPTPPTSDGFRDRVDPHHAWMNLCQISKSIWGRIRSSCGNGSDLSRDVRRATDEHNRRPTDSQLLPLTLPLIRLRQVRGCKPCPYLRGASCSSISQDFNPRAPR